MVRREKSTEFQSRHALAPGTILTRGPGTVSAPWRLSKPLAKLASGVTRAISRRTV